MNNGFSCANFAVAGSVSPTGRLFAMLQHNPGKLGQHLLRDTGGQLWFKRRIGVDHAFQHQTWRAFRDEECSHRRIHRHWPVVEMQFAEPDLGPLTFSITAFAPLREGDDGRDSSLRALMVRITVHNRGMEDVEGLGVVFENDLEANTQWTLHGFNGRGENAGAEDLTVPEGQSLTRWFILVHRDPDWLDPIESPADFASGLARRAPSLLEATRALGRRLPSVGEPDLDRYMRWNSTAAVMLTKMTCHGDILTMGYQPLNQRDSFWTSFLHLLLWPGLERRMIEASIEAQGPNGKIPTCILPTIDREIDIDINAYFVLRVTRYLATHPDSVLSEKWWPAVNRALDFLTTLDDEKLGLPFQRTYWGDWKDVQGVAERTYSPHASLITAAAFEQGGALASVVGQDKAARTWREYFRKAMDQINRPFSEGGLWNGRFYQQRWQDGRDDGVILQDQILAGLFGVIDGDKLASIWNVLDSRARGPFGISETWPHYPESFGYRPGHYHNGGVWPWLSYADAWCRLSMGRREDGLDLLRTVAWADLEREGDHLPHEYIAFETGENCGPDIQGWTASYVGAMIWGIKGEGMPLL